MSPGKGKRKMCPYCNFCDTRCFVPNPKLPGYLLATCAAGREHDRAAVGYDIDTARAQQVADLIYYQILPPVFAYNRFGFPFFPDFGAYWTAEDGSRWICGRRHWYRQSAGVRSGS